MKQKTILFFIFLFFVSNVLATGFSPASITLDLEPTQQECKTVTITSDSEIITISDQWAENTDVEWKVSLFDKDSSYHNLNLDYQTELATEREVEVCLSGTTPGEYHGVLLLREEQVGNSIVQMGIWLKVIIEEKTQEETNEQPPQENNNDGASGSSGSSGGSTTTPTIKTEPKETPKQGPKEDLKERTIEETTSKESNQLTGKTIDIKSNSIWKAPAITVSVCILALLIIFLISKIGGRK